MRMKPLWKRITSAFLTAVMVLGIVLSPLPGDFFVRLVDAAEFTYTVSKEDLALGANVIPAALADNETFLNNYVRKNGTTMGLNSMFKLDSTEKNNPYNATNAESTLSRKTIGRNKNGGGWKANYKAAFPDAVLTDSYEIRVEANVKADYHKNGWYNGYNHWDVSYVDLYGIERLTAKKENDDEWQAVSTSFSASKLTHGFFDGSLNCNLGNDEPTTCECGATSVSGTTIYMVKTDSPYVTSAYLTTDATGTNKISNGYSFGNNEKITAYVVLEFSEPVRFSDNKGETLTLNLDAYYTQNNRSLDSKNQIRAELITMESQKMIFEFSVPSTIGGENTDIYISGISSEQEFINNSDKYDLYIYDANGDKFECGSQTAANYITDYVGNEINWGSSNRGLGNIHFDNVSPTMTNISMTGSMITADSTTSEENWSDGVDRSAVFAGVGDWVSFQMDFSEYVKGFNVSSVKAILSIYDKDGSAADTIELGASSYRYGTLYFNKLTITEDMKEAGTRIVITGFEGLNNVTDDYGNALAKGDKYSQDLTEVTLTPAQQIRLDVDAPLIETEETEDNPNDGVYTPIASANGGEYFTFPLVISEDVSNTGKDKTSQLDTTAEVYILMDGDQKAYTWYVDTNSSVDAEKMEQNGKNGNTGAAKADASQNTYELVDGTTFYLHIKLDENTDYNYKPADGGIYFEAEILVSAKDYAGNETTASYPVKHQVDQIAPTAEITNAPQLKVDYDNGKAQVITSFKAEDNYALKKVTYQWIVSSAGGTVETKDPQTVTWDEMTTNYTSGEVIYEFTFDKDGDTGRQGTAQLTVTAEDYLGKSVEISTTEFSYDFRKAQPATYVAGGTKENPVLVPSVTILEPIQGGTDAGAENTRTVMFIKTADNGDDTYTYWGYDTLGYQYDDNYNVVYELSYQDIDLIDDMLNNKEAAGGKWFKVVGNIDTEENTGSFTSAQTQYYYSELQDFIKSCYGEIEIICVTSSEFDTTTSSLSKSSYEFSSATSMVEKYTCYLGNGADYEVTFGAIKDADGVDAADKLAYEAGKTPAENLDNVSITINVANVTEGEDSMNYGFSQFDKEKSIIELHYYGNKKNGYGDTYISDSGTLRYTWQMTGTASQTVVIPTGVATEIGWYGIWVITYNANGEEVMTRIDTNFFMDPVVLDININSYKKTYSYKKVENEGTDTEKTYTSKFIARNDSNLAETDVVELALGTVPNEYWSVDTYLSFGRTKRSSTEVGSYDMTELLKVRVYNKADKNYEDNAIWLDAADMTEWKYTPVCVEEITADSYGTEDALTLPLYEGDNVICFEMINTNGVTVSKDQVIYVTMPSNGVSIESKITKVSERTSGIMEMEVTAQLPVDLSPVAAATLSNENYDWSNKGDNSILGCIPASDITGVFRESYTFTDDTEKEFWVLDENGNLYAQYLTMENVDGDGPYNVTAIKVDEGYGNSGLFNCAVTIQDKDGFVNADEVTLTFDTDYSAVLLGLTGEERANNEYQVTMKVPINKEVDEEGNYVPWVSYETTNYGIYKTQLYSETYNEEYGAYEVFFHIWGIWKTDTEADENTDLQKDRVLTFGAMDANGTGSSGECTYGYQSPYYWLATGSNDDEDGFDWDKAFYEDGVLGIYTDLPMNSIDSYGAGNLKEGYHEYYSTEVWYTTAPMIQQDGSYIFKATDLFGVEHELDLYVWAYEDLGFEVSFSETDTTNQDVTVYAKAVSDGHVITSITGLTESGQTITGTIDSEDPSKASIVMPENGTVTIIKDGTYEEEGSEENDYYEEDENNTRVVPVLNIDKELEETNVIFYTSDGTELSGDESEVDDVVTAQVHCDETLYGTNGTLSHDFPRGSKKDDTYTFEFEDAAGNTGFVTAVLPCNISELPEGTVDTEAPKLAVTAYGMRNLKYSFIAEVLRAEAEDISNAANAYAAQEYRFILTITDDSNTKVVIQPSGKDAPTSYSSAEQGSTVDFVQLQSNVMTITDNGTFDLYIIDAADNVTALTGITVTALQNAAIEYYVDYQPGYDENGHAIVTATFLPVNEEDELTPITGLDETLPTRLVMTSQENPDYDAEDEYNTEPPFIYAERYYYTFTDNGAYTFYYRDEMGNLGEVLAQVQSMSTAAAVVEYVSWYGTKGNVEPDQSNMVNKDVTAELNMSKAVSDVKLYVYDADAGNGLGDLVEEDAPIYVTFTGKNVYVTYTGNVDYKIAISFRAAESGKTGYYVLPAVNCIDKDAPVVTLAGTSVSANNRSMDLTFTTDEATLLAEDASVGYSKNHSLMITGNQEKELRFSDKAGNITIYTVTENADLDVTYLNVVYSPTGSDDDAVTDAVNDMKLDVGESFYIKTNKKADIILDGEEMGTAEADVWTKLTLPETAGVHILRLIDTNTGEVLYDNVASQPKDTIPPTMELASNTIIVLEGISVDTMMEKINEGITITDNVDGTITEYTVTGYPDTVKSGLYTLTYKAEDAAGNSTVGKRTLYIMKEGTPLLIANGEAALPYSATILDETTIKLEVSGIGNDGEDLVIKWRSGMKTTAQMKHSTNTVENMEFTVSESGYYTIYVRTQDRVEYVTYIYVEE